MNILIVDDIIVNRILLKEILKEFNCTLFEAQNGKVAIDIIASKKVDLVLMDIEMPVMNGLETSLHIREKLLIPPSKLPLIALTAHDPKQFFKNIDETGFNLCITKPYTYQKIKAV